MGWVIEDFSYLIGAVASLGAAFFVWQKIWRRGRAWLYRFFRLDVVDQFREFSGAVLVDVKELKEELGKLKGWVKEVNAEINFNGGSSVKDKVYAIVRMDEIDFRMRPQPAFQCSGDGENMNVSDAYVDLVGTHSIEQVAGLSWQSFIVPEDLDNYNDFWQRSLKINTGFVTVCGMQDVHQRYRGKWRIKVIPVAPFTKAGEVGYLYNGYLTPVDSEARKIWEENYWRI